MDDLMYRHEASDMLQRIQDSTIQDPAVRQKLNVIEYALRSFLRNEPFAHYAKLLAESFDDMPQLREGMSDGDWSKLGLVFGLLWGKLDQLIGAVRDGNSLLRSQRR